MTRRRSRSAVITALLLTVVAASCGSDSKLTTASIPATSPAVTTTVTVAGAAPTDSATSPEPANTVPPVTSPTTLSGSTPTADVDPALDDDIQTATSDLAARLGIDESTIETVSATTTEWPDGGLGCPKAGMSYTQVPVDGAEIVLLAGGKQYSYHEGGAQAPFLCEQTATKTPDVGSLPPLVAGTLPGG